MGHFEDSLDRFHEEAAAARGLEDFGSDDYREALEVLCASLDREAGLNPEGQAAFEAMIEDALEARLLVEEGTKRSPAAEAFRIERPLVIIGLPRTGTTALQHLIAQDPGFQALEHWLMRTPKPRPTRSEWSADPDFQASAARVDAMFARSPEMRAIHEIEADLPDECWNLFAQNFLHTSYEANAHVPGYAAWWPQQSLSPVYARHRRNAQLIGHREPERRFVFKDATHLFGLDELLESYPDAMIVQTHRDPAELIPSVCSLCWAVRGALAPGLDREAFGEATLALWQRGMTGMLRAREGHDPAQFFDLPFKAFVSNPLGAVRDIYSHFGLAYSDAADQAIARFHVAHPRGAQGEHVYSAEDWGLDPVEIGERFDEYIRVFGDAILGRGTG